MVGSVPVSDPRTAPGGPSRRAVLRVGLGMPLARPLLGLSALAGTLVGCTTPQAPEPPPEPDPDVALTAQAADRERSLLAAYDAALAAVPSLTDRLAPLRAEHAEHLAALGALDPAPTPSSTSAPPTSSPPVSPPAPPSPPPTGPAPVTDPATVLASLAEAERTVSGRHGDAAVRAGRELAGVLAALAASEAAHPVALG